MSIVNAVLRAFPERAIHVVCAAVVLTLIVGWLVLMGFAWVWIIRWAVAA